MYPLATPYFSSTDKLTCTSCKHRKQNDEKKQKTMLILCASRNLPDAFAHPLTSGGLLLNPITYGLGAFSVIGPRLWNELPMAIAGLHVTSSYFKIRNYQTFLFFSFIRDERPSKNSTFYKYLA